MNVTIENLEMRYGRHVALRGVGLRFGDGVTGLLGPNGAGKSTLMKILATLLVPQKGRVRVGDWALPAAQQPLREHLGYLPQEFGLPANLTGREYLRYAAVMKDVPASEADRWLSEVGLDEAANRRLGGYSGGMKQRIGIAQALLSDPDLLIVDEPTAGLDPEQRTRLRNLIAARRSGRSTLFSTHVVADLEQIADRVAVLHQGEVRFVGTLDELAARAEGYVWSLSSPAAAPRPAGAKVIAERLHEGRMLRRLLLPRRPDPNAEPVTPTAEEGYLSLIAWSAEVAR